jgi:hypothetical protein
MNQQGKKCMSNVKILKNKIKSNENTYDFITDITNNKINSITNTTNPTIQNSNSISISNSNINIDKENSCFANNKNINKIKIKNANTNNSNKDNDKDKEKYKEKFLNKIFFLKENKIDNENENHDKSYKTFDNFIVTNFAKMNNNNKDKYKMNINKSNYDSDKNDANGSVYSKDKKNMSVLSSIISKEKLKTFNILLEDKEKKNIKKKILQNKNSNSKTNSNSNSRSKSKSKSYSIKNGKDREKNDIPLTMWIENIEESLNFSVNTILHKNNNNKEENDDDEEKFTLDEIYIKTELNNHNNSNSIIDKFNDKNKINFNKNYNKANTFEISKENLNFKNSEIIFEAEKKSMMLLENNFLNTFNDTCSLNSNSSRDDYNNNGKSILEDKSEIFNDSAEETVYIRRQDSISIANYEKNKNIIVIFFYLYLIFLFLRKNLKKCKKNIRVKLMGLNLI